MKNRMTRLRQVAAPVVAIVLLGVCWGCGRPAYHHYMSPAGRGWSGGDTLRFHVPPVSRTGYYALSLGMRLGIDFPYEGVWVAVETSLTSPDSLLVDTLYFRAIKKGGRPQGSGINMSQDEQPFDSLRLLGGQGAEIRVYHLMSREVLPAVLDVGLLITLL